MKIGELSSLLGIPRETIRYYEKMGMISSVRDRKSDYREYTLWDVFGLQDCLRLCQYGFSLQESVRFSRDATLDELFVRLEKAKREIEKELQWKTLLRESIQENIEALHTAGLNLGRYWFEPFEACVHYSVMRREEMEEYTLAVENEETFRSWVKQQAFFHAAVFVDANAVQRKEGQADEIWSYLIKRRYLEALSLPRAATMEDIPAHIGLCTVVDIGEKGNMSNAIFYPLLCEAKRCAQGRLQGDRLYGIIIGRISKSGKLHQYIKLVAPIATDGKKD